MEHTKQKLSKKEIHFFWVSFSIFINNQVAIFSIFCFDPSILSYRFCTKDLIQSWQGQKGPQFQTHA